MRDLDALERQALIQYAKEELRSLKYTEAEIRELEEKGEIVRFYGHILNERIYNYVN